MSTERQKPWVLTVRIEPGDIDDVRQAWADHFGEPLRNATREAVEEWVKEMVHGGIATA